MLLQVTMFCARQSTDGFLSAAERQLILYDIVTRIRTEAPVSVGGVKFHQHESIVSGLVSNNVIKQVCRFYTDRSCFLSTKICFVQV